MPAFLLLSTMCNEVFYRRTRIAQNGLFLVFFIFCKSLTKNERPTLGRSAGSSSSSCLKCSADPGVVCKTKRSSYLFLYMWGPPPRWGMLFMMVKHTVTVYICSCTTTRVVWTCTVLPLSSVSVAPLQFDLTWFYMISGACQITQHHLSVGCCSQLTTHV